VSNNQSLTLLSCQKFPVKKLMLCKPYSMRLPEHQKEGELFYAFLGAVVNSQFFTYYK